MANNVSQFNALELERLNLVSDYVNLMIQLESHLDRCRLCLSKTKAIVGFSNASASLPDLRDMEPTVRVHLDEQKSVFVLDVKETNESGDSSVANKSENKSSESPFKTPKNYKPFGELEPQSAKQARLVAGKMIVMTLELATLYQKIQKLQQQLKTS